jgi:formiminotetrahydrofolate cyclodeaminase
MSLPLLPQDKANHAVYGAVIAAIVSIVGLPLALLVVAGFALGKEVYDWRQNKQPEIMDAVATVCGGLLVLAPQFINRGF